MFFVSKNRNYFEKFHVYAASRISLKETSAQTPQQHYEQFHWCGSFVSFFCSFSLTRSITLAFNLVITLFYYIHHLYAVNVIHIMYVESKQIFQREFENISQFSQFVYFHRFAYSLYNTLANLFMTSCCSLLL